MIKASINSFLTQAVADIDDLETLVGEQFATLEGQVKGIFGNLENAFQPGQTFNQFANAQGGNPAGSSLAAALAAGAAASGNSLAAQPLNTGFAQHGPRCNYMHTHAKSYFSGPGASALPRLAAGQDGGTRAILDLVQNNRAGNTLNTRMQSL